MNKRISLYYIVNVAILSGAFLGIGSILYPEVLITLQQEKIISLCFAFVLMLTVYIIKAMKLYLIMIERRITLRRYMRLYIKTSLVNLSFPYKMGEIFRLYCYGREMQDYKTAVVCLLIDRFFDTVPLLVLLLCFTGLSSKVVLPVVAALSLFLAFMCIIYLIFPSTFCYLNDFLIVNVNSVRGIKALLYLNKFKVWYEFSSRLIRGRSVVLLILSTITWLMEYGILCCLAWGREGYFTLGEFVDYMNSVFVGGNNLYVKLYVGVSVLLFLLSALVIYGLSIYKRE